MRNRTKFLVAWLALAFVATGQVQSVQRLYEKGLKAIKNGAPESQILDGAKHPGYER